MATAALAAVLASALCASALQVQQEPAQEQLSLIQTQQVPLEDPKPADLTAWSDGPKVVGPKDLHHVQINSSRGSNTIGIEAFHWSVDFEVSGALLSGRGWKKKLTRQLCSDYQRYGDVGNVLDVGASIGAMTIPLADCIAGKGKVLAVEGMPPTVDHLVMGILGNNMNNVDVYNFAVGASDDPGTVTMSLNPVDKGGSAVKGNKPFTELVGFQAMHDFFKSNVAVKDFDVSLTTGDNMLLNNPEMKAIMMARIDIGGHEGHFLKGSQILFSQFPPCSVTIELTPEWLERAGTPVQDVLDQFTNWGYVDVPTIANLNVTQNMMLMMSVSVSEPNVTSMVQKDMEKCKERVKSCASGKECPRITLPRAVPVKDPDFKPEEEETAEEVPKPLEVTIFSSGSAGEANQSKAAAVEEGSAVLKMGEKPPTHRKPRSLLEQDQPKRRKPRSLLQQ
jgi:FkbM family methyltransferase